ncbi:hypothetical protein [uncultured Shimia sp.]|uniref:hypothetical protein n=1 Tax=uncultured Shimia sp. TaxID=573152 RepID=UPI0025DF46C1|nr:hypothetical protein [uncultured Shimia sp.]
MSGLETRLLAAHVADDKMALVALYEEAAAVTDTPEAKGFFLTQAYVYALEAGHPKAAGLHQKLKATGRES